jgi:predicted Zn-dependent peptidase
MSKIQKTSLYDSNGVNCITEEMPDVESSSIGIWITTGSRHEAGRVSGISHFIEHLLFKGTSRRTSLQISREIESVGGVLNAFTSREYTCLYAKVLNKDIEIAVDLLSDIFMNSRFDPSEIEKERLVVLQEIKMVEDTPDDLIHDMFAEGFWKGSALGRPTLGTARSVQAIDRAVIMDYFKGNYCSNRVFITAAGGLRHNTVLRLLRKRFKGFRRVCAKRGNVLPRPHAGLRLVPKDLEQVHLCLGVPAPPQPNPERFKVYLLNTILGGGMSSRLFQEIREKRGLAYSVYSYLNLWKDAGSLVVYAGTSADAFQKVTGLTLKEMSSIASKGVGAKELKCAKEQLKGGMLLGLETSDSRMTKLARDEIYFGRDIPVREIVKGIDSVTLNDVKQMAGAMFKPSGIMLAAMGKVSQDALPGQLRQMARAL